MRTTLSRFLNRRTLCAFALLLGSSFAAPAAPRVLASGNPPLTSDMAAKASGFFEWVLDARFTPAQQQEYEQMLVRDWPDDTKRKSTMELLRSVDQLAALSEEKRRSLLPQLQGTMVESFRKEKQDPDARWMLAVFEAAHPGGRGAATVSLPKYPALEGNQLVGKWRSSNVSAIQYKSAATGVSAPTNGSSFSYTFKSDGTYDFNGLMQVTMYNCSTSVFNTEAGTYTISGDRLITQSVSGVSKVQQTCGANKNYEKAVEPKKSEHIVHFERNSSGTLEMIMNGTSGNTRPDYFRKEQ